MIYITLLVSALLLLPASQASAALRGHAAIDEAIVPGEPADVARAVAFTRARLEVIDRLADALRAQGHGNQWSDAALHAAVEEHATMRVLRELEQDDPQQLHIIVELEGWLDPALLPPHPPRSEAYHQARSHFDDLYDLVRTVRREVMDGSDGQTPAPVILRLERLDVGLVRAACFTDYPLAGETYCRSYRRTAEEDFRLVSMILECGGDEGWRLFSPLHRMAAFFSTQLQALQDRKVTPEQVMRRHLQHKQWVLERFPYLRQSSDPSVLTVIDADWHMQEPTSGDARGEDPLKDWPPQLVMVSLERELALWRGITTGWNIMKDALGDRCDGGRPEDRFEPTLAREADRTP